MRTVLRRVLPVALAVLAFDAVSAAAVTVQITADTNRDGIVSAEDLAARGRWTPARGAVYLPNLDDDGRRCRAGVVAVERCADGRDRRVNGPADLADLARVRLAPITDLGPRARGRIIVTGAGARNTRVFRRTSKGWQPAAGRILTRAELRRGVELAVEGIAIPTSADERRVSIVASLSDRGRRYSDRVALALAPMVFQHDLQPAQTMIMAGPVGPARVADAMAPTTGSRLPSPTSAAAIHRLTTRGQRDFQLGLRAAVAAAAGPRVRLVRSPDDIWTQDQFEAGWVEMPGRNGLPHRMRVVLRSPPEVNWDGRLAPRLGKAAIWDALGHADVGIADVRPRGLQNPLVDPSLNSMGNLDGLPPSGAHRFGAILIGSSSTRRPDPALLAMLRAQESQPVVTIDTSWLAVGHVDEIVHVMPAATPRGWTLAVADPLGAVALLRSARDAGHGDARFDDPVPGEDGMTIDEVLGDARIMADNRTSAAEIDRVVAQLGRSVGITPDELVRVPVLMSRDAYSSPERTARGVRYPMGTLAPNVVNGITLSPGHYVSPDPHGPLVEGEDVFKRATREALQPLGVTVHFVENRVFLHDGGGEVHCGTNVLRAPGDTVYGARM